MRERERERERRERARQAERGGEKEERAHRVCTLLTLLGDRLPPCWHHPGTLDSMPLCVSPCYGSRMAHRQREEKVHVRSAQGLEARGSVFDPANQSIRAVTPGNLDNCFQKKWCIFHEAKDSPFSTKGTKKCSARASSRHVLCMSAEVGRPQLDLLNCTRLTTDTDTTQLAYWVCYALYLLSYAGKPYRAICSAARVRPYRSVSLKCAPRCGARLEV